MTFDHRIFTAVQGPAIDRTGLTAENMRSIFAALAPSQSLLRPNLADGDNAQRLAGVLIPLVVTTSGIEVLLTRRALHLYEHAGQISFPGGRLDAQDLSLYETALRETEEEIGLLRSRIEMLGVLPNYCSISGYLITPWVGLVQEPLELQADPFEVAEIFQVPLAFLMDPAHHRLHEIITPNDKRLVYSMPYGEYFIWGVTAAILRSLYSLLLSVDLKNMAAE